MGSNAKPRHKQYTKQRNKNHVRKYFKPIPNTLRTNRKNKDGTRSKARMPYVPHVVLAYNQPSIKKTPREGTQNRCTRDRNKSYGICRRYSSDSRNQRRLAETSQNNGMRIRENRTENKPGKKRLHSIRRKTGNRTHDTPR